MYRAAGLHPVPAPLRDDPHWLTVADRPLPTLVRTDDLRGTIHNHTTASDGAHTLREMCDGARERGLGYFGVCDHSRSLQIAHGLSVEELDDQIERVRQLNADYRVGGRRLPRVRRLRGGHPVGRHDGLPRRRAGPASTW